MLKTHWSPSESELFWLLKVMPSGCVFNQHPIRVQYFFFPSCLIFCNELKPYVCQEHTYLDQEIEVLLPRTYLKWCKYVRENTVFEAT